MAAVKTNAVGLCKEKLKKKYNIEEEVSTVISGVGTDNLGKIFNEIREVKETRFTHDQQKRSVTLGKSRLAIIKEQPYAGWEEYKPLIIEAFEAYNFVSKQKKIERIGLRYINNIHIKEDAVDEKKYFNVYPEYESLSEKCVKYDVRIVFDCEDNNFLNLVIVTNVSKEKKETIFRVDFDYFTTDYNKKLNKKDVELWLDRGHKVINEYFEKIITNNTRKLFK